MSTRIDNLKEDGCNIYSTVDEAYHYNVVGETSNQPGNTVVEAMNGGAPELSGIYPMTDFVDIVLNKHSFLWKLEHALKNQFPTARILLENNLYLHPNILLRFQNSPQLVTPANLYLCLTHRHIRMKHLCLNRGHSRNQLG
mmetsp:Transcript_13494/g.14524  ORF Transcript_13494/g.14524 Transcript_13494/m.14524 type:complete len:141 (-) Transcript_13494:941-1363(-)